MDYLWQFHVHHIIPEKAYDDGLVRQALEAAGFFQQAKGNKIALFASSETAAIARQSINNGSNFYLDAGFGGSVHPGRETGLSHKGYNDFALARLEAIMLLDPADQRAAFTKLHAFLTDVSEGRFANLGVESSFAALGSTWADHDPSPAELSQHAADYDPTITDADGLSNAEERYDRVRDLIEKAHDAGHLTAARRVFRPQLIPQIEEARSRDNAPRLQTCR